MALQLMLWDSGWWDVGGKKCDSDELRVLLMTLALRVPHEAKRAAL